MLLYWQIWVWFLTHTFFLNLQFRSISFLCTEGKKSNNLCVNPSSPKRKLSLSLFLITAKNKIRFLYTYNFYLHYSELITYSHIVWFRNILLIYSFEAIYVNIGMLLNFMLVFINVSTSFCFKQLPRMQSTNLILIAVEF